jgi:transposase
VADGALAGAKKKSDEEGLTPLFLDESGFYLLPAVARTWAPVGQTPCLRQYWSRDHISAISAVSPDGRLYLMSKRDSLKGPDVVVFLQHLMEQIPGKLLVVWDRGSIHRAKGVLEFVERHRPRLQIEWLPAYAPDLNPDEGIWQYLKNVELRNRVTFNLTALRRQVVQAASRLRRRPALVRACMGVAGLLL